MHSPIIRVIGQRLAITPMPDSQRQRVTRTFYIILRIVIAGMTAQLAVIVLNPGLSTQLAATLVSVLLMIGAVRLMHVGRVRAAAGLMVFTLWLHITLASYIDAGLYSASTIAYSITVLIAGIMLGGRAALGLGLLTMLSLTGMYVGWEVGLIRPRPDYFEFISSMWLVHTLVVLISGTLIWIASDMLNRVFEQLDERNRELQREIEERRLLEAQQTQLLIAQERAEFLAQFLGEISEITHDLKGPLSIINTSLYFLERPLEPEARQQRIQRIQEQTQVMQKYIQNILTISRLERETALHPQPVELNGLATSAADSFRGQMAAKNLMLQLDMAENLCIIQADVAQLNRAICNLIENAVLYTPPGGSITLSTCQRDGQVCLAVSDTGIGIAPDEQPRIFDRFYRGELTRVEHQDGTGLGLAIVKKIIELHGGDITVESVVGQGSTFSLWLPCAVWVTA